MFNVGGGELLVIMLVALIILGPTKLPEVARQVGAMARELRRISSGFQDEMRAALEDPVEEASRERGRKIVASEQAAAPETETTPEAAAEPEPEEEPAAETEPEPEVSTAEAAGMYDIDPTPAVDTETDAEADTETETATGDPEEETSP